MIRVLIADDHVIVRKGLEQFFEAIGGIAVAGEAANGDELLAVMRQNHFDLIMLDLKMPGLSGIRLIESIRALDPSVPILVLSMHDDLQTAKRVLQAGASGFVTKTSGPETLVEAIRKVAGGTRFIDPSIVEMLMLERPKSGEMAAHERLSPRELQIMKLIAKGKNLVEIGEALFISNKTVSTHKVRLMQKLNLQNTADLVRYAADHGLID